MNSIFRLRNSDLKTEKKRCFEYFNAVPRVVVPPSTPALSLLYRYYSSNDYFLPNCGEFCLPEQYIDFRRRTILQDRICLVNFRMDVI